MPKCRVRLIFVRLVMPWHSRITRQRIQCVFIHRGTVTKVGITVGRPHLKVTLQSIGFS